MRMELQNGFSLGLIQKKDKTAFLKYLTDRDIYRFTLRIPNPYLPEDADWWIDFVDQKSLELRRPYHFAIRDSLDELVGAIGFHDQEPGQDHKAELGYWVAKPFWGKGIATSAVTRLCEYGFADVGLRRITASVFIHNPTSMRVLEKCGFTLEATLKNYYQKDGEIFDGKLYAMTR